MQSLKENIHIEDKYSGVTLGAINLPRGLIFIDAPLIPEDGRSWRADLLHLESGHERLLINLDTNIDRIIGVRAMDASVLAHENLAGFFRNRSGIFKLQGQRTGAEWENIPNLGNIRWAPPQLTFTEKTTIHWGETPLILEHHPGADRGAIWVIFPEEKIVFVGDTILKNQPPFFANANLPHWIEDLDILASKTYKGYTLVSGRGGVCATRTLDKQRQIIEDTHKRFESLAAVSAEAEATEKMIPTLLKSLRFLASERESYTQRLHYGLAQYYLRNYIEEKEETK